MTTSATDIAGNNRLSTVEVPHIESLEELDAHFEQTYGPEVMTALRDSNSDQAAVVEALHKAGLNGRSEAVERTYRLHQQEFARKESLLGTTWRWTKEAASTAGNVIAAPFRWTWESFKAHPVLTTAAVGGLALGGVGAYLYYAGQLEAALAAVGLDKVGAFFTEAATELAPLTPDLPAVPGAGEAGLPGGVAPPQAPPTFGA